MSKSKDAYAIPSPAQIEKEAYARWERRGYIHGSDREDWQAAEWDLTFDLNYRPVVHHRLDSSEIVSLGASKPARCRFCEQAPATAKFSAAGAPWPGFLFGSSIVSLDTCDDCDQSFRSNLEPGLRRFWDSLPSLIEGEPGVPGASLVAFKALTWLALALMPEAELEHFPDALEWVSNPEHDDDSSLFSRLVCLAYSMNMTSPLDWVTLDRRRDDDALLPSLIFTLSRGGTILQLPVPMGVLDQELDGEDIRLIRRSWTLAGASGLGICRLLTPTPDPVPARRASRSWLDG